MIVINRYSQDNFYDSVRNIIVDCTHAIKIGFIVTVSHMIIRKLNITVVCHEANLVMIMSLNTLTSTFYLSIHNLFALIKRRIFTIFIGYNMFN